MKVYPTWISGLVAVFSMCCGYGQNITENRNRPNILIVMTDQQNASMMSCTGNPWLKTPAMDAMAARGIRFEKAYVTNPVCSPSRFSIVTGHYPSIIGMRENTRDGIRKSVLDSLHTVSLGHVFRRAGYETLYGGKAHFPGSDYSDVAPWGFERLTFDEREGLAKDCAEFLLQRKKTDRPFMLVASFINPHDICANAIDFAGLKPDIGYVKDDTRQELKKARQIPEGITEQEFFDRFCPPLPANHQPMIGETSEVERFLKLRPFQHIVRERWSEKDWRMHIWAYMRLTELVDRQIGMVMKALQQSGLEDNTIVVFTSDHGEHAGAHKLEHKTLFYEESVRVPFVVIDPRAERKGIVDKQHVVNNGLDLLPTLCDFAGIAPPQGLPGSSLLPLVRQKKDTPWRTHTFIENQIGFLVHDGRYKYELDDRGAIREMFVDLKKDPGETRNLINHRRYARQIRSMRSQLMDYLGAAGIAIEPPGKPIHP